MYSLNSVGVAVMWIISWLTRAWTSAQTSVGGVGRLQVSRASIRQVITTLLATCWIKHSFTSGRQSSRSFFTHSLVWVCVCVCFNILYLYIYYYFDYENYIKISYINIFLTWQINTKQNETSVLQEKFVV